MLNNIQYVMHFFSRFRAVLFKFIYLRRRYN